MLLYVNMDEIHGNFVFEVEAVCMVVGRACVCYVKGGA